MNRIAVSCVASQEGQMPVGGPRVPAPLVLRGWRRDLVDVGIHPKRRLGNCGGGCSSGWAGM
jgi:hypothetical protein